MKYSAASLPFGKYKGCALGSLTDEKYLMWLAKPVYSGKFYKSIHSTELNWKVPLEVKVMARVELEKRGYKLIGERWER
jgi:hypothetical protein